MGKKPETRYGYQYGSEAYKSSAVPYPLPRQEEPPLTRRRTQPNKKEAIFFNLKMGICGLILFGAAFSFVYVSAQLTIKQNELKAINTELRDTKSAINSIESTIASTLNLEYIQYIASTQLDMSEPLPHQVVYIELPKESHTVYNE
ncbi:MAG: hypothetical protein RR618_03795 [Cellulosilyticaceae bacterium]